MTDNVKIYAAERRRLYEKLEKEADYALNSRSLSLAYEVYGKAIMAYELNAITKEAYFSLNKKLVREGMSNPKARLE